jgi:hypothetical protein
VPGKIETVGFQFKAHRYADARAIALSQVRLSLVRLSSVVHLKAIIA